jgi:hypothetical protein
MAKHLVKCYVCHQQFDANVTPFIRVGKNGRYYAHKDCSVEQRDEHRLTAGEARVNAAGTDKDELDRAQAINKRALYDYINKVMKDNIDINWPLVTREINKYTKERKWTYSGIHRTIIYYLEVLKKDIFTTGGHIAFVERYYPEAREYYFVLFQEKSQMLAALPDELVHEKNISITPPTPRRNIKLFDLGEDE